MKRGQSIYLGLIALFLISILFVSGCGNPNQGNNQTNGNNGNKNSIMNHCGFPIDSYTPENLKAAGFVGTGETFFPTVTLGIFDTISELKAHGYIVDEAKKIMWKNEGDSECELHLPIILQDKCTAFMVSIVYDSYKTGEGLTAKGLYDQMLPMGALETNEFGDASFELRKTEDVSPDLNYSTPIVKNFETINEIEFNKGNYDVLINMYYGNVGAYDPSVELANNEQCINFYKTNPLSTETSQKMMANMKVIAKVINQALP